MSDIIIEVAPDGSIEVATTTQSEVVVSATSPTVAVSASGPPGPTAVSSDAGNVAALGSDGLIFVSPTAGGVSDHGALTGLADDDHPQYAKKVSVLKTIIDYGADPTGVAASDAAFAAFMADENESAVRIPGGNYTITTPIVMRSGKQMHGDHAARDGGETTRAAVITQYTNNAAIITGVDIRGVTLANLALAVADKANHTADGISFTRSANPATNYVTLKDVHVFGPGRDGIAMSNLIVSAWSGVTVVNSGRHGFNLYGVENGAAGTSVSMDACYANTCGAKQTGHGFNIRKMTYLSLTGCASEGNTGSAYYIAKSQGISLAGCGAEAPFGPDSFHVAEGSLGVVLNACWTYGNNGVAFDVDGASTATLIGCTEMDPTGTPVASFRTAAGTKVTLIDPTGYTARVLDSSTVLIGNSAGQVEANLVKGAVVQGNSVVAKPASGLAILAADRPAASANSQLEFRTSGATANGWALTHLATSNNLRIWNFTANKNALVLDAAGTYMDVVSKRIINVAEPTAATDAATKSYVDGHLTPAEVVAGTNVTVDRTTTPGSVIISAAGGGVTDHGALTGLGDDDHPQYALADGSRGTFEVAGAVAAHAAAADPHPNYLTAAEAPQPSAVAGTDDSLTAGAVGVSAAYARADHAHKVPTTTNAPNAVGGAAGAAGTSTNVARHDHTHRVDTGTPVALGSVIAAGTSNQIARADHVHPFPTAANVGADPAGTATSALSAHNAAPDPHPQYLTQTEGDGRYPQTAHSHDHGALTGLGDDDHPQYVKKSGDTMTGPLTSPDIGANTVSVYVAPTLDNHAATKGYVDGAVTAHEAAAIPHPGFIKQDGSLPFTGDVTVAAAGIILDAPGTAYIAIDKNAPENYGMFEFRTNGVQKYAVGSFPDGSLAIAVSDVGSALSVDPLSARCTVLGPTASGHVATKGYVDGRIWSGTQAEYDALPTKDPAVTYIVV